MTKNISLADDAYEALLRARKSGESFSDLARRLAKNDAGNRLLEPGRRFKMTRADAEAWKKKIYAERERSMKKRGWEQ